MLIIQNKPFALKLEPIVSFQDEGMGAFEVLSRPMAKNVDTQRFFNELDEASLSSLFVRQLELFQKLNQQDRFTYRSLFINFDPRMVGQWLSWQDFIPFIFQFRVHIEVDMVKAKTALTVHTMEMLSKLKTMGVGLWLDDVDENYHSLPICITNLFDGIKLDKHFVWHCMETNDFSLIAHLVTTWGVKNIIAEGIETESMFNSLRRNGIGMGQGFHWETQYPTVERTDRNVYCLGSEHVARNTEGYI